MATNKKQIIKDIFRTSKLLSPIINNTKIITVIPNDLPYAIKLYSNITETWHVEQPFRHDLHHGVYIQLTFNENTRHQVRPYVIIFEGAPKFGKFIINLIKEEFGSIEKFIEEMLKNSDNITQLFLIKPKVKKIFTID